MVKYNTQALHGVRVLEFPVAMAGPWIGRHMAFCGAEVIRVESNTAPDVNRNTPWFMEWNAGKRSIGLDLTKPQAVEICMRLVSKCDVIVENYRPGVMDKLGLGYSELIQVKPDIIMFSTSGYGDYGPHYLYRSWGPNIEHLAGLAQFSGFPHRKGAMTQYAYPDALSALNGVFAVMCALDYRLRTGKGQHINVSQWETTVSVVGHVMMEYLANSSEPRRKGNQSLYAAPQGCYRCQGEDRWCTISVLNDNDWKSFCDVIGRSDWIENPKFRTLASRLENNNELDRSIEEWTVNRSAYEVMTLMQKAGIAAGVVQTAEDLYHNDPHLADRGFFQEIEHRERGKAVVTGIPLGLTATPGHTGPTGGLPGRDNDYVFTELLDMRREEVDKHIETGVIDTFQE